MSFLKKAFIYGTTDLGELLYANIRDTGAAEIVAFVVDAAYKTSDAFLDLPLYAAEELPRMLPPREFACYLAVGYSRMNANRAALFRRMKSRGYALPDFIHPRALVKTSSRGEGNIFFADVGVDYYSELGSGNIFYPGSSFAHHSAAGDFNFFAVSSCVAGHARMGDNNFIGANATIINNITIGDSCLIGAGATLTADLSSRAVYVNPRGYILEGKTGEDFL